MTDLASRVIAGEARAVARALSLVEAGGVQAASLLARLAPSAGRAYRVGLTGPPGAGKSSLVNRLIAEWRSRGRKVAVLAVDPSSPFSGGAVLGDRVRMQEHAGDPFVFIRSMATRGQLGGLAPATAGAALVLDAAGFDIVVIETVGVGQDEIDIVGAAEVVVVVLVPGTGDDLQALKAGVMEVADLFAINKADLPGADRAVAAVQSLLALDDQPAGETGWAVPVVPVSAVSGQGVVELVEALDRFRAKAHPRQTRAPASVGRPANVPVLDHVAIATGTLGEMLSWCHDVLGLPVTPAEDLKAHGVRVAFAGAGDARIEILEPLGEGSPLSRFLARRGDGLHHVALRVADLAAELTRLRTLGVRLIDDAPREGADGARVAFIHPASARGVLVELIEAREGQSDDAVRSV